MKTAPGKSLNRVDGPAKVNGKARYAADHPHPDLLHGHLVGAAIARGRITGVDTSEALAQTGVIEVYTHENAPRPAFFDRSYKDQLAPEGHPLRPLQGDEVHFSGQPVALVVADSIEAARHAAALVKITYEKEEHASNLEEQRPEAEDSGDAPEPRGDADQALLHAEHSIHQQYSTPVEHHNPMEPFASTVIREADGTYTVYEKTQGVLNCHKYLTKVFGLRNKEVKVLSPFVGGAFGSGLRPGHQLYLAMMAAIQLQRSVRVVLERKEMFALGFRAPSIHNVRLGSSGAGKLEALTHDVLAATSRIEKFHRPIVEWSAGLYACENVRTSQQIAALDVNTPCDMRAPGAAEGVFPVESAMDELAWKAGLDPLEFRLANYAEKDPVSGKPYSSKALRECYMQGAERIGWAKRSRACRANREGSTLRGLGMATGSWDAMQMPASARAELRADGSLVVSSATADIGTGTYTIMTQIAAETLGLPEEKVSFILGDSTLPMAPVQGGSFTAASVGSAVLKACSKVKAKLLKIARDLDDSPFASIDIEDIRLEEGHLTSGDARMPIAEVLRQAKSKGITCKSIALPQLLKRRKVSCKTHSAVFAEVEVDDDFGTVHVKRVVCAVAAGRILNPKTARSQIIGGVVWGISMALHEDSYLDRASGRFINHDFAGYHIPVSADIGEIEVIFVPEEDEIVNPLGVKGVGEIGIVGTAAAIANAIFHATGKRVRELPIMPDKLL